jgi:two-component system phosphate regulon sensor histidine kinase PhoR
MKLKAQYLYYLIGLVMAGLISIQVYWIANSIRLQKTAVDRILKEDVEKVAKQVEEEAYCFTFLSKGYIKKGEGIYLVKQKWQDGKFHGPKEGGYLDTMDLFNVFYMDKDTAFYKERSIWFETRPATVDVSMKFTFVGLNPNIKRRDTGSYIINNLNAGNYKTVLANKFRIDEAIDVNLLDSLLKDVLKRNKLSTQYYAGIRKQGEKSFEYLMPGTAVRHLRSGVITAGGMLNNRFNKPYELVMFVPDSFNSAVRSMSVMMLSSFFIVLILVLSYAYFVRTIMRQRKLSEMKNTFINNITHEFRTPITNINLAVENWKDMPDRGRQYMNIIEEESRHMEKNVEQILQLATIEHSKGYYTRENVNVHDLIEETLSCFRIQLEQVSAEVIRQFNAADPWVRADRNQLKNMLHNLIDNAIKYRNTVHKLSLAVATYNIGQQFSIQVEDNGIGMAPDTQKYIFNRFYRGHTGDRHDVKGFGLGLSYVKHIVDTHGGEIHVRSRLLRGTKFTIYLPKNIDL